jgi:hypothetical protein
VLVKGASRGCNYSLLANEKANVSIIVADNRNRSTKRPFCCRTSGEAARHDSLNRDGCEGGKNVLQCQDEDAEVTAVSGATRSRRVWRRGRLPEMAGSFSESRAGSLRLGLRD